MKAKSVKKAITLTKAIPDTLAMTKRNKSMPSLLDTRAKTSAKGGLTNEALGYFLALAAQAVAAKAPQSGLYQFATALGKMHQEKARAKALEAARRGEPVSGIDIFVGGPGLAKEIESLRQAVPLQEAEVEKKKAEAEYLGKKAETEVSPLEVEEARGREQRKTLEARTKEERKILRAKTDEELRFAREAKRAGLLKTWTPIGDGRVVDTYSGTIVEPPSSYPSIMSEEEWERSLKAYDAILRTLQLKYKDAGLEVVPDDKGGYGVRASDKSVAERFSRELEAKVRQAIESGVIHPKFNFFITLPSPTVGGEEGEEGSSGYEKLEIFTPARFPNKQFIAIGGDKAMELEKAIDEGYIVLDNNGYPRQLKPFPGEEEEEAEEVKPRPKAYRPLTPTMHAR